MSPQEADERVRRVGDLRSRNEGKLLRMLSLLVVGMEEERDAHISGFWLHWQTRDTTPERQIDRKIQEVVSLNRTPPVQEIPLHGMYKERMNRRSRLEGPQATGHQNAGVKYHTKLEIWGH